jgi:hypothetical protein
MSVVVTILGALLFAPACLLFLMWLSHLEDTLQRDVHRARRRPEPPPIVAIPVRRTDEPVPLIPEQRAAPAVERAGIDGVPAT